MASLCKVAPSDQACKRFTYAERNVRLAAIKSFMHFVEYRVPALLEQSRRILAIPTKKTDQPLIQHLSMAEMQAIQPSLARQCIDHVADKAFERLILHELLVDLRVVL